MIPIRQQYNNDCLRCCIASILEVDVEILPRPNPLHFTSDDAFRPYEEELGRVLAEVLNVELVTITPGAWRPRGYAIADVYESETHARLGAPTHVGHAVVEFNGQELWNPSDDKRGIEMPARFVSSYELLVPIDPSAPYGAAKLRVEQERVLRSMLQAQGCTPDVIAEQTPNLCEEEARVVAHNDMLRRLQARAPKSAPRTADLQAEAISDTDYELVPAQPFLLSAQVLDRAIDEHGHQEASC